MINESTGNGLSAGAGLGMRFGEMFRADVTAEYRGIVAASGSYQSGAGTESTSIDGYVGFANAYLDFNKFEKFTPYVGAGVGAAYLRAGGVKTLGFAWNANVGTSFKVTDNIELDINYRYTDLGTARSPSSVSPGRNVNWDIVDHDIRMGVRFNIN